MITLSGFAPADTQEKLIRAAADAGVPWILPNEWAPDTANEDLVRDVPFGFPSKRELHLCQWPCDFESTDLPSQPLPASSSRTWARAASSAYRRASGMNGVSL